jgi:hypothetical protein
VVVFIQLVNLQKMQALIANREVIEFALPSTVALKPVLRSEIKIRLEKLSDKHESHPELTIEIR